MVADMFMIRQRPVWLMASRAAAALASRSQELHEQIGRAWRALAAGAEPLGPEDPAARWTGRSAEQNKHARRHFLHLRAGLAARGCPLQGESQEALLALPATLPDVFDQSAAIHGMAEIATWGNASPETLRAPIRKLLKALAKRALPMGYQQHEAMCALASALDRDPDLQREVVKSLFAAPRKTSSGNLEKRLEAAIATAESARTVARLPCFQSEEGQRQFEAWVEGTGDWNRAVRLSLSFLSGAESSPLVVNPSRALVERLSACRPVMLRTTPESEVVSLLAELVLLCDWPANASLPWSDLVDRAGLEQVPGLPLDGRTWQVADTDLSTRLVDAGFGEVRVLLHRHRRTRETTVVMLRAALGGQPGEPGRRQPAGRNQFLLVQSAIAAAEMLYEPVEEGCLRMEQKVQLLWSLLELDPPVSYWEEIRSVLRGEGTQLHQLVDAMDELDASRPTPDSDMPATDVSQPFTQWEQYEKARKSLCKTGKQLADLGVTALADAMDRAPDDRWPELPTKLWGVSWSNLSEWRARLDALLASSQPPGTGGTVTAWVAWLRASVRANPTSEASSDALVQTVGDLLQWLHLLEERGKGERLRAVDLERARDLARETTSALHALGIAWPPQCLVDVPLAQLEHWCEKLLAVTTQREEREAELMHAIAAGDEQSVLDGFRPGPDGRCESARQLSGTTLRAAHQFLLAQLLYRDATRVRRMILAERPEVQVSSIVVHFAPLWSGVLGGAFFTLSLAKTWNDLARLGGPPFFVALGGSVVGAWAFLMYDLRGRVHSLPGEETSVWSKVATRVAPAFGASVMIAVLETLALLWVCQGTESVISGTLAGFELDLGTAAGVRAAALWSAITLFGGIFVGLVAQGRGAVSER
jgi:hypothetical protein